MVQAGEIYRHFKGGMYGVLAVAKHHDSKEDWVVYKDLYTNEIYIRPINNFESNTLSDQKRFVLVDKVNIKFG